MAKVLATPDTDMLTRAHADRLATALAGLDCETQARHLADRIERLIQALLGEGVPVEQAARYAGDVTASALTRLRQGESFGIGHA